MMVMILLLTGCWDRIEIEDRGFVIGVAIDLPENESVEQHTSQEEANKPRGQARFLATYQFVNPAALSGGTNQGGGGGEPVFNLTTEGDTIMEINRSLATRTSRSPYLGHTKVVIISEEVAQSKHFANVMDFLLRYQEFRRSTQLMIAKDKAKEIIEIKPDLEKLPVMYIQSVGQNNYRSARMVAPTEIGDVHHDLLAGSSYVIQRIVGSDKEVKVAGSAVFHGKDNAFIGWLGEEETEGLNFIKGELEAGMLKVQVEDNLIGYEIKGATRDITVDKSNKENLKFTINIISEGNVPESLETLSWDRIDVLANVQGKVEEEVVRITEDAVNKLHGDFKTDALGLGQYLSKNEPKLWEEIKDDWEEGRGYFSKSSITVKAEVEIRNTGVIIKSEPVQD